MASLGEFRRRLTVERAVETTDGAAGTVVTYTDLPGLIPARAVPAGATEALDPHAQRAHDQLRFQLWRGYAPRDLARTDRIRDEGGRRFEILAIEDDPAGARAWLQLTVAEMTETVA